MRALLISRWFPPEQHSGTLRIAAFARYLPEHGVNTAVFSGAPELPSSVQSFSAAVMNDWLETDTVEVTRCDWSGWSREDFRKQLLRLPLGATWARRALRHETVRKLAGKAGEMMRGHKPDVILATVAPPESLYLALHLRNLSGVPVVADLRDPWTYASTAPHRHYIDFLLERREERQLLSRCARVVVTTDASRHLLETKVGIARERIVVIPNGSDLQYSPRGCDIDQGLDPGRVVIAHVGELSACEQLTRGWKIGLKKALGFDYDPLHTDFTTRSPRYFLEACERFLQEHSAWRDRLRLWFVGLNTPEKYGSLQQFAFPECLRVVPRVGAIEAASVLRQADILLLLQNQYFLDGREFGVAVAAKTYAYLAAGRPILAALQESEMAALVRRHGRGRVVAPKDVSAIGKALEELLFESDRFAKAEVTSNATGEFDRRTQTKALAELFYALRHSSVPRNRIDQSGFEKMDLVKSEDQ